MRRPHPETMLTNGQLRAVAATSIKLIHYNLTQLFGRPSLQACPPEVMRYLKDAAAALERAGAAASPSETAAEPAARAAEALYAHLFGTRHGIGTVATAKDAAGRDKIVVYIIGAWHDDMPAVWEGHEVEWFTSFGKIRALAR